MNIIKNTSLSRRTLLRGVGAALALPWLEAMQVRKLLGSEQENAPSKAPVRMAVLFMPNGVPPKKWTPEGEGAEFKLSPILEPLAAHQKDILVLTQLWNKNSDSGDGHYVKTAGLLTSTTINKTVGVDLNCNGVSMDQVAAQKIGHLTPLPSIELGIEPVAVGIDGVVGYTRVYGAHIAWRGPTSPLAKEINPRLAYERIVRAGQQGGASLQADRSVLDMVMEDAQELQGRLGANDRRRVDEYLESVRALEQRMERLASTQGDPWKPRASYDGMAKPEDAIPKQHLEHCRLMIDLMVLAFQTDTTRVATFMFGNSVSNINFSWLDGVKDAHHSLSHHQNEEDKLRQYEIIAKWHMEQYAYMLERMKSLREGEQSLLANSMVMFGSDLRDGNAHDPHNLPIVLAGQGGGRITTGRHVINSRNTPLANLYLSMLDVMGTPVEKFADSTEKLALEA
ncbi:MAG: DUF1552 domain-containing protein [Planctomycetaceae bacterium]|nr:DUF1552 domain-containing protein [Planctomycetaceae bacterium]